MRERLDLRTDAGLTSRKWPNHEIERATTDDGGRGAGMSEAGNPVSALEVGFNRMGREFAWLGRIGQPPECGRASNAL